MTEEELKNKHEWSKLIFGVFGSKTILDAVSDEDWQRTRSSMLGTTLKEKFETLELFLARREDEVAKVCVTNYVNALKRGGLIK